MISDFFFILEQFEDKCFIFYLPFLKVRNQTLSDYFILENSLTKFEMLQILFLFHVVALCTLNI